MKRFVSTKQFEEIQRYGARYLAPLTCGYSPFPLGIVFVLTLRCNMRCQMCVQSELRAEAREQRVEELSAAELQATLDDIRRSFPLRPMIHVSGGEPFLHRGAMGFIGSAKQQGFRVSLTTNGLLLEERAQELVTLGVDRVNVSLDGPREVHDELRNTPGAFDRALAGIQALNRHKRERGVATPSVTINCVLTKASQPYLPCMIQLAQEVGAQGLTFQHLKFADGAGEEGCQNDEALHDLDVEGLLELMPRLTRQAAASKLAFSFFPRLTPAQIRAYYHKRTEELGGYCVMPWAVMRIRLDGEISPCSGYVVDHLRHKQGSLARVWNSPRYRAFRQRLARERVFASCGRCCHRRYP